MNEEQLKILLQKKARLALLGELMPGVCHELNNPLTITLGNLGILDKYIKKSAPEHTEKLLGFTSEIMIASVRIQKIVATLRAIAKAEMADRPTNEKPAILFEQVQIFLKTRLVREKIELLLPTLFPEVLIPCHSGHVIEALLRIILNLIENQNKISNKDIEVFIEQHDSLEIFITSHSGFLTEMGSQLFDPFATIEGHDPLSLSIAKECLEANKGSLRFCQKNHHWGFEILLPFREPENENTTR